MAGSRNNSDLGVSLGLSFLGAYNNTPKARSNKGDMKKAAVVGNWDYGSPTSMAGLESQYLSTPQLVDASRATYFNPTKKELFGSFLGAGLSSYGASQALTGPLHNLNSKEGWGGISAGGTNATSSFTPTGKGGVDVEGLQAAMNRGDNEAKWDEVENNFANAGVGFIARDLSQAANPQYYIDGSWDNPNYTAMTFACGGHKHGCGGHKFGGGGSALATGIDLSNAGLGMLFNWMGIEKQKRIAEMEAAETNLTNDYARQMQQHNFTDIALPNTKNNMFNQQALQMMAFGGDLHSHGADWPLKGEYNIIGAGGTHEQNPFGGVYQGMAADGKPNLVEEDEVVWNDYVFSNRIKIPKAFAGERKLKEDLTFAEAAQKLSKEAEERPNDPISQNSLNEALGALMQTQEEVKAKREAARMKRQISQMSPDELAALGDILGQAEGQPFAYGGFFGDNAHLFKGTETSTSRMSRKAGKRAEERRAQAAAEAEDRGLFEDLFTNGNMDITTLKDIASQLEGYNPSDYIYTDAAQLLRQFILSQYGKKSKNGNDVNFNTLNSYITGRKKLRTKDINNISYKRTQDRINALKAEAEAAKRLWETHGDERERERMNKDLAEIEKLEKSITTYDFAEANKKRAERKAYSRSREQGNASDTYTYEKELTEDQIKAVEQSPDYIDETDLVLSLIKKAQTEKLSDDENTWLTNYFLDIDGNIPIAQRNKNSKVKSYLKYDAKGNVLIDDYGNPVFEDDVYGEAADGHSGRFYEMRNDHKVGMVHQTSNFPKKVRRNPGERFVVRVKNPNSPDGFDVIELSEEEIQKNPYFRKLAQSKEDDVVYDEQGNALTTHYADYEPLSYEAEYSPEDKETPKKRPLPTWMRYAPLAAGFIGQPDYDYSTGFSPRNANYVPIGDYLAYNPVDTQRYINANNQQANAQLNAIMNASSGNRNMAMAQAALANGQRIQGIGQILQAAEAMNFGRRAQTGEFNRGTNMFNAQAHNTAELANLQNNPLLLRQEQQNAMMRHVVDSERDAARSANLSTALQTLSDIGNENLAWNQAMDNEALDYKPIFDIFHQGRSQFDAPTVKTVTKKTGADTKGSAFGGYLLSNRKKNRR